MGLVGCSYLGDVCCGVVEKRKVTVRLVRRCYQTLRFCGAAHVTMYRWCWLPQVTCNVHGVAAAFLDTAALLQCCYK
jgi:hypothetical protein